MVKNKYPIPLIADLFDQLGRARYFTKLDLRSGYYQVRIAEGDEPKTTCVTRSSTHLDKFVVVYLDDIVIYSNTLKEYVEHLRKVFKILRQNELYLKKEKCSFAKEEVSFLGHRIKDGKLMMDDSKVKAIQEWDPPTKVPQLKSFLGLVNYYRRFIKGYSTRAASLTDLLKKNKAWEWDERCQQAFEDLKKTVTEEPVLALPDHTKGFEVHTDASDFAIGGVLMQDRHPIAFESRKLNDTERRYTVQEKEMTAIVHGLRTWRHYLLGSHFLVKTDNVATSYFQIASVHDESTLRRHNGSSKGGLQHDPVAKSLIALTHEGKTKRFWVENDLLYTKGRRLYVPKWGNIRRNMIKECHDTSGLGTLDNDAQGHYSSRLITGLKYGMRPVGATTIAERPWDNVTMDFIIGLPKSEDSDSIIVVVDRFSNSSSVIATCVSLGSFGRSSSSLWVRSSTSPQASPTDEWANREGERLTGALPKALRDQPVRASHKAATVNSSHSNNWLYREKSSSLQVCKRWHEQADIACSYLDKAAKKMKKWADKKRQHTEFKVGDMVLVKLLPQQFKSLRPVHKDLVRRLKIHPVFHVSYLKPYHEDKDDPSRELSKRAPTAVVTSYDKEVEHIIADRVIRRQVYLLLRNT
ncbi:Retrovirus-related Pol polyprotein from transposon 17.6 [Vitis vinifera]|uniref:Retrovirus-related Pol polyprotein from transposon 17.6 n=1 Tax=Vitis vinifera TaxID=29760 RepID=A0A438EEN9_VITVI|nr:Retrovirus-related Pol polyprotein from transposon 17.6 [Vitis vinifera]